MDRFIDVDVSDRFILKQSYLVGFQDCSDGDGDFPVLLFYLLELFLSAVFYDVLFDVYNGVLKTH